ncbi:hypothetical protein HPB50_028509 [Hyalomma asiaticum]|nr:hypothetical protein HPB50_028509 [Hyalomma asiaticum]
MSGQVWFLKDNLRVLCGGGRTTMGQQRSYQDWSKTAEQTTEFFWARVRLQLPRKEKARQTNGKVLVLGGAKLPDDVTELLKKRPKYASEPVLSPPEKITRSRDVSRRVSEDLRQGCLSECVDVVGRTETWGRRRSCPAESVGTMEIFLMITFLLQKYRI